MVRFIVDLLRYCVHFGLTVAQLSEIVFGFRRALFLCALLSCSASLLCSDSYFRSRHPRVEQGLSEREKREAAEAAQRAIEIHLAKIAQQTPSTSHCQCICKQCVVCKR